MAFNMNPSSTQVKYPFNGHLNPNEVFGDIYNMILYQEVRYPELADNYNFVEMFRIDGSMYGDTALFYDQDILTSREWLGDLEAQNLLSIERPADPECQAVTVDKFRIIKTSLDSYLTKRAWSTEGAFTTFQGIVRSMISKTKKMYEVTLINAYLGSIHGEGNRSLIEVPLSDYADVTSIEEKNRLEAQTIAQYIADLLVDMKDYSRDFNDYKFMRAYTEDELQIVWNTKFINKINKLDLPTIFNKAGLMDKFEQHVLPARFFTEPVVAANASVDGLSLLDTTVTIGSGYAGRKIVTYKEGNFVDATDGNKLVHRYIGEELPKGASFELGEAGFADEDVVCKIITKDTIKYMAAFETATEFYNPQTLTTSNMLIWGYGAPARLKGQPCVTVHAD